MLLHDRSLYCIKKDNIQADYLILVGFALLGWHAETPDGTFLWTSLMDKSLILPPGLPEGPATCDLPTAVAHRKYRRAIAVTASVIWWHNCAIETSEPTRQMFLKIIA